MGKIAIGALDASYNFACDFAHAEDRALYYHSAMRYVSLKALRRKLSEYVNFAAEGETVLITDRDRVIAEIVPPQPGRTPFLDDPVLADAVRRGWITPPAQAGGNPPRRKPVMRFSELMRELKHDRND